MIHYIDNLQAHQLQIDKNLYQVKQDFYLLRFISAAETRDQTARENILYKVPTPLTFPLLKSSLFSVTFSVMI